ncbi:protease modulator HflC [Morganella psychrotolerans]|uniref:protease modulator HflC n=1 Tax=Morganella psychrotolerans TaxID=368603 RepID=UPI0039B00C4B
MRKYLAVIVILVLGVLYASVFAVQQTERGIVLRFGKVLRDSDNKPIVYEPGLHLKVPFIETVKTLPARIQTLDIQADRFLTNENKDLIVDSYLKWRISDFSLYYLATNSGNINQAENLLKRKFSDRLRSEFGRLSVKEIVTDSRGTLTTEVKNALNEGSSGNDPKATDADNAIADAAARVQEETKGAQPLVVNPNSMAALGIEVVDVRIKQINLPAEVSEAIFQRMRAEREAVARRHRSQGLEEAMKIRAIADKTRTEMLAESERQSLTLRGAGDAEAAKLFADAFSQDPDFYAFIRSLRAYEQSFKPGGNDIMVLSPDTDFFRYMKAPTSLRPASGQ